jgi:hypothetical protein
VGGSFISATGLHLSSIRPFADRADERDFTEQDVYSNNDFNSVQRRARVAMWTLNGLLLVPLAFAVRRTFGPGVRARDLPDIFVRAATFPVTALIRNLDCFRVSRLACSRFSFVRPAIEG